MPPAAVTLASIILDSANSVGAVKSRASDIVAQSRGLDSASVFEMTGRSISNLQDQINTLQSSFGSLAGLIASGAISGGISVTLQKVLLTNATVTNIVPTDTAPADTDVLVVKVTQSPAGTGGITWHASFKGVTSNDIEPTADCLNLYLFMGIDGVWCCLAIPRVGVTP